MKLQILIVTTLSVGSIFLAACSSSIENSTTELSISTGAETAKEIETPSKTEDISTETLSYDTNMDEPLIEVVPMVDRYQLTDSKFPGYPIEINYIKKDANAAEYIFLNAKCSSGKFVQWAEGYPVQYLADSSLIRDEPFPIYWVPDEGDSKGCDIIFTIYYSDVAVPIKEIPAQILLDSDNYYSFTSEG